MHRHFGFAGESRGLLIKRRTVGWARGLTVRTHPIPSDALCLTDIRKAGTWFFWDSILFILVPSGWQETQHPGGDQIRTHLARFGSYAEGPLGFWNRFCQDIHKHLFKDKLVRN